jgi:hypothetical protein
MATAERTADSPTETLGKPRDTRIENVENAEQQRAKEAGLYNEGVDTSAVDERRLLRRIDLRLIPWLSFLYLLSFLDRTSIGCVYCLTEVVE